MKHKNKPLAAFEKVFWLMDQTSQVHFVLAAEISGTATADQWRAALDTVQRRHPLFSVYIESDGYKRPYFKSIPEVQIPLKIIEGDPLSDWKRAMENEMSVPFDWTKGPLVRVVLIKEDQKSILIMVVHHSIGDGISMSFVIRDILLALSSGETPEPLPMPASTDDLLGLTDPAQSQPFPEENKPVFLRRKESTPDIKLLKLSKDLTISITERARQEGTTVQGALCAAFKRAYYSQVSEDKKEMPVRIVTPISIRNMLNAGQSSSLSISSRHASFNQNKEIPFWDIARYATNDLKEAVTLEGVTSAMTAMHEGVFSDIDINLLSEALQSRIPREMMISNLGPLTYETRFGSLKLEAIWGPLALSGFKGEHTIGVSTVNGSMCLSVASRTPFDNLLNAAKNELIIACL